MMKGSAVTILWALSVFLLLGEVVARRPRKCRGDFMCRIRRRHDRDPHCDGGPSDPPEQGEVCGSCGGFAGADCEYGLYCEIISGDLGICLPIRGPGSGTYGQKGGVCGRCRSCTRKHRRCKKGLHCEGGICIPNKKPVPPPKKADVCESCGYAFRTECKKDLYCQPVDVDIGICIPIYGNGAGTYGQKGGVCGPCESICNSGSCCLPELHCEFNTGGNGICKPNPNHDPVPPPRNVDICQSCNLCNPMHCKKGLDCYPVSAYNGICIPIDGPGAGTYGQKGGVCGNCDPFCNSAAQCLQGLHCESTKDVNGICIPNHGSWECDPCKGEVYTDCGSACPLACGNYTEHNPCILICVAGCFCPSDKVRREYDDRCVNPEDCWLK